MPQRTTAQKAALAKGRENAHSSVKDFEEAFKKANTDLESATVKLDVLEADLHGARLECGDLRQKLVLSSDKCKSLSEELKLQKEKNKRLYQDLWDERQGRQ